MSLIFQAVPSSYLWNSCETRDTLYDFTYSLFNLTARSTIRAPKKIFFPFKTNLAALQGELNPLDVRLPFPLRPGEGRGIDKKKPKERADR